MAALGTLKADWVQDDAGFAISPTNLAFSQCTCWCHFNGTGTVAIVDSFNVSSVTDHSTGNYSVNFQAAMANADYAAAVTCGAATAASSSSFGPETSAPTVNAFRLLTGNSGWGDTDKEYVYLTIHGGWY